MKPLAVRTLVRRILRFLHQHFLKPGSRIPLSTIGPDPNSANAVLGHKTKEREPHKIKLLRRGETAIQEYAPEDFQHAAGHSYVPELVFADERTFQTVRTQCESAVRNGAITVEMKWLGALYAEQIRSNSVADVSIRWIDERLGYGLFADRKIEAGECIGEYAGIVRRRSLLFRNFNEYCFSYPTSDLSFRKYIIDAQDNGNELRYANHGEEPNCEATCVLLDGILHILIRAIRDIPANAQITYDYSQDYWARRTSVPN